MFADDLPELRALRDDYNPHSKEDQHEQYRVILAAIPILVNFYIVMLQLLRRHLVDVPLLMNIFAKTFLATLANIRTVNAEIHAVADARIGRLAPLEAICEQWRTRDPDGNAAA